MKLHCALDSFVEQGAALLEADQASLITTSVLRLKRSQT